MTVFLMTFNSFPGFLFVKKIVEMGGLEPPSKRRTRQLSTCLSVPLVFDRRLPEGGPSAAYPLNLSGT